MKYKWASGLLLFVLTVSTQAQVVARKTYSNSGYGVESIAGSITPQFTADSLVVTVSGACAAAPTLADTDAHSWIEDSNIASQPDKYGNQRMLAIFHAAGMDTNLTNITASFQNAGCSYPTLTIRELTGSVTIDVGATGESAASSATTLLLGTLNTTAADTIVAAVADSYGFGGLTCENSWTCLVDANSAGGNPSQSQDIYLSVPSTVVVSMQIASAGYCFAGATVAYKTGMATPPSSPQRVPVQFNLTVAGAPATGTITLYSDVTANGTTTKTPIANWTLANGSASAYLLNVSTGWYEFDLAGPVPASEAFLPGAFAGALSGAHSITVNCSLDPTAGTPTIPCGIGLQ